MEESQLQTPKIPKQIFILSGQSNMAGRGGVIRHPNQHHKHWDHAVPPECQPNPNILRLTADLKWIPAHEPLHADIDSKKVCGVGPGMSFANSVRDPAGTVAMGLVPCAVGGTAIKEWARGEKLYETMVKRAKESVKDGGGEIKGLLWYQGESDALNEHDADAYHGNMERFVQNVRDDLGLPQLPIIQVAIISGGDEKHIEKVRKAQLGMKVANVVCVDAKGLELGGDSLHLTTKAQVKLGQMLAQAYLHHFAPSMGLGLTSKRQPNSYIFVAIISGGDEKHIEKVREAQLGMKVANVVCVDAKGLELGGDNLHLTTNAQVKLGQMLAQAYLHHFAPSNI